MTSKEIGHVTVIYCSLWLDGIACIFAFIHVCWQKVGGLSKNLRTFAAIPMKFGDGWLESPVGLI